MRPRVRRPRKWHNQARGAREGFSFRSPPSAWLFAGCDDGDGTFEVAADTLLATLAYDGLGRRIAKTVDNAADWECTYHMYYDLAWGRIEDRDDSGCVLRQYVWGARYVDNVLEIGINTDPADGQEDDCEDFYYPVQDANFNVVGLVDSAGTLLERYEYTPYGERTVYGRSGSDDTITSAPLYESQRVNTGTEQDPLWAPYSLCDLGHQGLFLDKEFSAYDNRRRVLSPPLARFLQRDPIGYADGMGLYQYVGSSPTGYLDWAGEQADRDRPYQGHFKDRPVLPQDADTGQDQRGPQKSTEGRLTRQQQLDQWQKEGQEGTAGLQGKGVGDRARYAADAMIKCAREPAKSLLKQLYAQDTGLAQGGYNGGGAWAPKGTSARNNNQPLQGPGYAGRERWQPGQSELSLPQDYGESNWRRGGFDANSQSELNALAGSGCFDLKDFDRMKTGQLKGFRPGGLIGLAASLAWESGHWTKGENGRQYNRSAPLNDQWQALLKPPNMDCCCLRLLLGLPAKPSTSGGTQ